MNFKGHFGTVLAVLIIFGSITYYIANVEIYLLIIMISTCVYLGAKIPDVDKGFDNRWHRHFLFHSIILPFGYFLISLQYPMLALLFAFWMLGAGTHCLFDIRLKKSARVGFYCIKLWAHYRISKGKWSVHGLNGKNSTIWLVGNFVASVVIFLLYLMFI